VTKPEPLRRFLDRGSLLPWLAAGALWFLTALLVAWVASYSGPAAARPLSGNWSALRHLLHHGFGASRRPARPLVEIDAHGLRPGDVIVASQADSPYGYYSHVTAVVGPGDMLSHHVAFGIYSSSIRTLRGYDHVRVLRAEGLSTAQQHAVGEFLRELVGAKFQMLAHKRDPRWWNCAKSVWAAYMRVGIDLVPDRDFIVPDDIAASPALKELRSWGGR